MPDILKIKLEKNDDKVVDKIVDKVGDISCISVKF